MSAETVVVSECCWKPLYPRFYCTRCSQKSEQLSCKNTSLFTVARNDLNNFFFLLFTHQILNLTKNTTEIKVGLIISFLCICSNLFCSVKDSVAGSQDPFMPNWFIHCNRDTQSQGMKRSCKRFNLNKAILADRREKADHLNVADISFFYFNRFFCQQY